MHCKKQNNTDTSSRSVRSQLTAISFSTEEHAILKESAESKDSISSKICCSKSFGTCVYKDTV